MEKEGLGFEGPKHIFVKHMSYVRKVWKFLIPIKYVINPVGINLFWVLNQSWLLGKTLR